MGAGGLLTLPWKFPQKSAKLTRWWEAGDGSRSGSGLHVLPFDIIENDQRIVHFLIKAITRPQTWVDERPSCMICKTDFTWTERRHHCRLCGRLCCRKCSEGAISTEAFPKMVAGMLADSGADKHRVCYVCEQVLGGRERNATLTSEDDEADRASFI